MLLYDKLNNLGLPLGMALKFRSSMARGKTGRGEFLAWCYFYMVKCNLYPDFIQLKARLNKLNK